MELVIENTRFKNRMRQDELPKFILHSSRITKTDHTYTIYYHKAVMLHDALFHMVLKFRNDFLSTISLVALKDQKNEQYIGLASKKELHEKWLHINYGNPSRVEVSGFFYDYNDGAICSQYDPRSKGSDIEIMFY